MSNILTAKVKIVGVRPLFWHKFGPDAMPLEKQERTGVAGNDPEEWRKTCLVAKDGQLYVQGTYIFGMMREAAKFTSKKRGNWTKDVSATLQCLDDRVMVNRWWPGFPNGNDFNVKTATPPPEDPDAPLYFDIRGVKNPSTGARNVRYRIAASPDWEVEFSLAWDRTIVPRDVMHTILIDGGRLVGIGNGRAIGMGRFEVASFEVVE